jgi:hypothetical protein
MNIEITILNNDDSEIKILKNVCNNALKYLPRAKSNFELVSNLNYDVKEVLYKGCQYYQNLLCEMDDFTLFKKLEELFKYNDKLINWSKHHKIDNPTNNITFNKIIKCLSDYFNIRVLASRLNYYDENDFKPFHHDSHAYTNGLKEDITIGLSLGDSRTLSFKHVETDKIFYFPQNNGDIFCFDHLTNKKFMHGIAKLKNNLEKNIRISIIIWGKKL